MRTAKFKSFGDENTIFVRKEEISLFLNELAE